MQEQPIVEGHGFCLCGNLHPTIALHRSAGTCPECEHRIFDRIERIEVTDAGRKYVIPVVRERKHRGRGAEKHRGLVRAARSAAMRRLKNLDRDLYEMLYADERRKRGLEAFPIEGVALPADAAEARLAAMEN